MSAPEPSSNESTSGASDANLTAVPTHPFVIDTSELDAHLFPADSYSHRTYWASLPRKDQHAFISHQQASESHAEWAVTWREFKNDPLMPVITYWRNYVMPGMGLFTEGYVLFSISNVKDLFQKVWPDCWKNYTSCNATMVQATDYLQVVGIILGQITVGVEGDWVGRRWGLVQDAAIMLIGTILLTSVWGASGNLEGWIVAYAISQLIYGFGVGGEYPMTATLSMESASSSSASTSDRLHRGRRTVGAFLMQGWGQVFNQAVLIILLLIFNGKGGGPYSLGAGQATYRVSFAFIALFILWLLYYRVFRLRGSDKAIRRAKRRQNVSGYDIRSLKLAFSFYWHRILATSIGWFCNDFFFYGNSIFRQEFISILVPGTSTIMPGYLWNLLNTFIALAGYYMAFAYVDNKRWGRRRMQATGFFMDFVLFTIAAFAYGPLTQPGAGVKGFQFIYFFSSFWAQFGPNCVTFLVAAEVYPASIRGSAHGFSAAVGKLGALAPTVLYNYIPSQTKFLVACWFALLGAIVTIVFLPDVTCLDLREQERRWQYCLAGREADYHGVAVHPRHLSLFERYVLKKHLAYDPEMDARQRTEEMRAAYVREQEEAQNSEKRVGGGGEEDEEDESEIPAGLHSYFQREYAASREGLLAPEIAKYYNSGLLGRTEKGTALH